MDLVVKRPKGTQDITPTEVYKWHTVEKIVSETAEMFGFKEIRMPTFEDTALFVRSVGDTTDVVQKEMYSVTAKGDAQFTLRPEGTAGAIRAMIENGVLNEGFPQKVYYVISCFRHEKPQSGRLREFHQFGCELVGTASPAADADLIALAKNVIDRAGLKNIELHINSIGCPECRAKYHAALKEYFADRKEQLCDTCLDRLERNPMRILDCKSPICSEISKNAPIILDYLCDDCKEHFEKLKATLGDMGIEYKVDPRIVRGLDYYTRTVFEFITTDIGAQGTVCGGGRYDGLIETLSGQSVPALGFGMGLERLILTMEKQGCEFLKPGSCDIFIAALDDAAVSKTVKLVMELRDMGIKADYDIVGRGLKAQMKYANKIGAKFSMVLGSNELESGKAALKNMADGSEKDISLDGFAQNFTDVLCSYMLSVEGLI